ncbi:hypothetical protein M3686_09695 [Micrococcus luteus]|uniref:hypothetical protein n=1 Tax=Micrococcus luteus TaxID=1270 RepID=UPI0020401884|nr:hypothetical protein [Micrococcus luteus]MCM3578400.1 hypothetical protein [Micrococcus luteus]
MAEYPDRYADQVENPQGRARTLARMSPEKREEFLRLEHELEQAFAEEDAQIEAQIAAEEAEDAERAAQGKRPLKRERDITTFEGFSGMGVTPRGW